MTEEVFFLVGSICQPCNPVLLASTDSSVFSTISPKSILYSCLCVERQGYSLLAPHESMAGPFQPIIYIPIPAAGMTTPQIHAKTSLVLAILLMSVCPSRERFFKVQKPSIVFLPPHQFQFLRTSSFFLQFPSSPSWAANQLRLTTSIHSYQNVFYPTILSLAVSFFLLAGSSFSRPYYSCSTCLLRPRLRLRLPSLRSRAATNHAPS
jgi:hypothetical protein